ncbi:unnamed protein product [Scytosiphon promiscuus]
MLDEASAVSNMLFLDEGDMSRRYDKVYAREDALNGFGASGSAGAPGADKNGRGLGLFGESALFFPAGEVGGGGGGDSAGAVGGVLAAAAGGGGASRAVDIRPEENKFCDAFLELQKLLKRLPPGARAQPDQVCRILHDMHTYSVEAEAAASESAGRLRELRGSGSPAVAVAAATAHELSLEKDTWALLLLMNGVDKEDAEIKEDMRRHEEDASFDDGVGAEEPPLHAPPGPNASDEEVLNSMRARDSEFRRTEAVVEWLQDAACARLGGALASSLPGGSGGGGGSRLGWSNTLESLAVGGGQKSEVAQMHPDSNLRGLRVAGGGGRGRVAGQEAGLRVMRLAGQDDLDEEELLRTAWVLARAGKLSRAKRLCESGGQPWRAAAMGGGGVVGTRKVEGEEEEELEDIQAGYGALYSPAQGVWQEMCWQLSVSLERGADSSDGPARSVAKHEAALFAHLAGNAELLLDSDLTQSWEDQAWVRFTALLHLKVLDERIRHRRAQAMLSSLYPGVTSLGADEHLLEKMRRSAPPRSHSAIFEVLEDASQGRVRAEGKGVYRQAQQALVLGGKDIPLFLRNILWRVAAAAGGDVDGEGGNDGLGGGAASPSPEELFRSPQLLRFAAHLALLLAAQCPYLTTMEGDTLEAIEDVVYAYAQHLANTQQVRLVAIYAATLPTRRRRELYAGFLRGVEGDESRREALEQAKTHMSADVPAILKKVVEDVRVQTVSVAPPMPRHVPEGDMNKIKAMSWLLDHADMRTEAAEQANALARHLLLQTYQQSVLGGGQGGAARGGGVPWAVSPGTDANYDDDLETPVVLSARVEAVQILLKALESAVESREGEGKDGVPGGESKAVADVEVGEDTGRELECWGLLLEAREAYLEWVDACRALEDSGGGGGVSGGDEEKDEAAEAVSNAADGAMEAFERVLTFEDGWMYPQDPTDRDDDDSAGGSGRTPLFARQPSRSSNGSSSLGSWEHVDAEDANPEGSGSGVAAPESTAAAGGGMVVSFPMEQDVEEVEDEEAFWGGGDEIRVREEKRKAKEVEMARQRRAREEEESIRGEEEAARRAGEVAREEELLRVREACLPGLVFLAHEVAHGTGLRMLRWVSAEAAPQWFTRAQSLANTIVKDEYRTLLAMSPRHMERLLQSVERSTTKLLECTEPSA